MTFSAGRGGSRRGIPPGGKRRGSEDLRNQKTLDIAPHEFTYSIVGHVGALDGAVATTHTLSRGETLLTKATCLWR